MKIIEIKSFKARIERYEGLFAHVELTDMKTGKKSVELIPISQLSKRGDAALPAKLLDGQGRLITETDLDLVKLVFDGYSRFALDEKSPIYYESEASDPLIQELEAALANGESETVELKSSTQFPPNPEDLGDKSFQMRELVRQCVAFANSKSHSGTIWVGVQEKNKIRRVVGVENEIPNYAPNCDLEKFQAYFLNLLKSLCGTSLLLSTSFTYVKYNGHTVIRLTIRHEGDVIYYGHTRDIYVRVGTAVHKVEEGYTEFIRNYKMLYN